MTVSGCKHPRLEAVKPLRGFQSDVCSCRLPPTSGSGFRSSHLANQNRMLGFLFDAFLQSLGVNGINQIPFKPSLYIFRGLQQGRRSVLYVCRIGNVRKKKRKEGRKEEGENS